MKNDGPSGENRFTGGDHSWIVLVHMLVLKKEGKPRKSQGALLTQSEESRDPRLVVIFGGGGGGLNVYISDIFWYKGSLECKKSSMCHCQQYHHIFPVTCFVWKHVFHVQTNWAFITKGSAFAPKGLYFPVKVPLKGTQIPPKTGNSRYLL